GQLADGVRGQEHRTTPHAGVAVGRVRRVQFVRTADPADRLALRDRVAELEGEVPRDTEAVGDPLACEPPYDVIRDSRLPTHRMLLGVTSDERRRLGFVTRHTSLVSGSMPTRESPQSNTRTKRARRNFSGESRLKDRLQAVAGLQFGAGKTRRKGHDRRMARGLGTAWDNRTVTCVVADLPGGMEYLPRRSGLGACPRTRPAGPLGPLLAPLPTFRLHSGQVNSPSGRSRSARA